jgi:hypothetical protein
VTGKPTASAVDVARASRIWSALAVAPLLVFALLHLRREWSIFDGHREWIEHARSRSDLASALWIAVLLVLSPIAWVRSRLDGGRASIRALAAAAWCWTSYHVLSLWLPRVLGRRSILEQLRSLEETGTPGHLGLTAFGLFVVCAGLGIGLARANDSWFPSADAESRHAARIVAGVGALCVWALFTQLAGFWATGLGTLWPIELVAP